jgi:hypothetical protein
MANNGKFKCTLCGRVTDRARTCCGEVALPVGEVRIEQPMEPWVCPECGATSDNPSTCCGKKAIPNPQFRR